MAEDDLESLKKRVFDLENENKDLRKQIDELREEDEEVVSYRLFIKAREHFLKWLNIITLGLASIGILTIAGLAWGVFLRLESKIQQVDTKRIEEYLQQLSSEKLDAEIAQYSQSTLRSTIESEVKAQVAQALGKPEPMFFVVAGSSRSSAELDSEYRRAKRISGNAFGVAEFDVKICEPAQEGGNYALIIGSKVQLSEAERIVQQAVADNFRATNTFPISESTAFFNASKCEVIQPSRTGKST